MNCPVSPDRGALRIVTGVAVRCDGRGARSRRTRVKRTVKSCGPDALAAGVPKQSAKAFCEGGDKQAQSRRGEHEVSRNPSRGESRVVPGYTCGPTPELSTFCSGPMGAIGTRLSLRPLFKRGRNEMQSSDDSCRENANLRPHPHCHRPARPGDPVRRGLSAQAPASLEYWITRMRG